MQSLSVLSGSIPTWVQYQALVSLVGEPAKVVSLKSMFVETSILYLPAQEPNLEVFPQIRT